jgi:hypothetical protein
MKDYREYTKEQLIEEVEHLQKIIKVQKSEKQSSQIVVEDPDTGDSDRNRGLRTVSEKVEEVLKKLNQKDIMLKMKSDVILNYTKQMEKMQGDLSEKVEKLAKANRDMAGREMRIIELKNEIKELKAKLGE